MRIYNFFKHKKFRQFCHKTFFIDRQLLYATHEAHNTDEYSSLLEAETSATTSKSYLKNQIQFIKNNLEKKKKKKKTRITEKNTHKYAE